MQTSWPPRCRGAPQSTDWSRALGETAVPLEPWDLLWQCRGGAPGLPAGPSGPWPYPRPRLIPRFAVSTSPVSAPAPPSPLCILPRPASTHPSPAREPHRRWRWRSPLLIAASLPKPRSVITEGADLQAQPPWSQALGPAQERRELITFFPSPSFKVGEPRHSWGRGR